MSKRVSIDSDPGPQPNQNHRSSDNFSTDMVDDWGNLMWSVSGGGSDDISFDVWIDISGGKDKHTLNGISDGSVTEFVKSRKLYIANPENAKTSFTVTAEAYHATSD